MFHTEIIDKIRAHILCSVTFFSFFRKRTVYVIMWKNILERRRPQMTIWRMRIVCWMPKATNTHTEVVFILSTFHCNNGCTNARECYVIRTLAVLFNYIFWLFVISNKFTYFQSHSLRLKWMM